MAVLRLFACACLLGLLHQVRGTPFGRDTNKETSYEDLTAFDVILAENEAAGLDLFEGDIQDSADQIRNAIQCTGRMWPKGQDGLVKIPYNITDGFTDEDVPALHRAFHEYAHKTCVDFFPVTSEHLDAYVSLEKSTSGCSSKFGNMKDGGQSLSLSASCIRRYGSVVHELMHAVGFKHEQARPDRDDYVTIVWGNIRDGKDNNFDKESEPVISTLDLPYDYGSVMHYSRTAFSTNGQDTIVPKVPDAQIGQRDQMSDLDALKINTLYGCGRTVTGAPTGTGLDMSANFVHLRADLDTTISCAFASGWCGYTQDTADDFDWSLNVLGEATPSGNTGPDHDHSTGEKAHGHFAFIEASSPRRDGDVAGLLSPISTARGPHCLKFYYHMYGEETGSLNLLYMDARSGAKNQIWSKSGEQGDLWVEARVDIDAQTDFQVMFEGVRGSGYHGDIGIDDVELVAGTCGSIHHCDFDVDFCGFQQLASDDLDWVRNTGHTPSATTGPDRDHTTGSSGHYIYVEASSQDRSDLGTLVSPEIPASTSGYCVTFWYHMYGRDTGFLRMRTVDRTGSDRLEFELIGEQGDLWKRADVFINPATDFRLHFQDYIGCYAYSDIGLDDIEWRAGRCDIV
ncbi:MEP1B [Branchiostoma lanceolatum]|uniref:Metalloendopeptidase n=1 Tax=Branchiostoma lanceolatum TaxID=7740 RepID=A0A8K0ABY5_BRALA|nr:MEP1B [Branchiostoma lanceolatum]